MKLFFTSYLLLLLIPLGKSIVAIFAFVLYTTDLTQNFEK